MSSRRSTKPTIAVAPREARATASSARRLASMNAALKRRSSGGYPGMASSGNATSAAPISRARSRVSTILRTLPSKSPTVELIWARAILEVFMSCPQLYSTSSREAGLQTPQRCKIAADARKDPLVAVDTSARGPRRAVPAMRAAGVHRVDAAPRRDEQAGAPHLGVYRVPGDRRASGARVDHGARRRLFLFALVVVGIGAALSLAELVQRVMVRRAASAPSHRYLTADPVLHHRARPGVSAIVA